MIVTAHNTDNLVYLKCGPCKKCYKRAIYMTSSIQGFSNLSINLDKSKTDLENAKGTNKVCAVKTRQQVSAENIWTPWNGGYSTPELQKLQRNDTDIGPIFLWKENGSRPTIKELENKSPATRHYWHLWDAIQIREGLLFKKFHRKNGSEDNTQLLVPFVRTSR